MSMLQDGDNIYGYCNVFKDGWVYNMYKGIDLKDIKRHSLFAIILKVRSLKFCKHLRMENCLVWQIQKK